jgi:hypothetical protein
MKRPFLGAPLVDIEAVADVDDAHVSHRFFPSPVVSAVGIIRVDSWVIAEGDGAHPYDGLAESVAVRVVKRKGAFRYRRPGAFQGIEFVHVEDVVAVRVALEVAFAAVLIAPEAPHQAVVIEVDPQPGVIQAALVEIADVHLVGVVIPVEILVIHQPVEESVAVPIGDITIGICVAPLLDASVFVVINDPHDGVELLSRAVDVVFAADEHPALSFALSDDEAFARLEGRRSRPPGFCFQVGKDAIFRHGRLFHPPGPLRVFARFQRFICANQAQRENIDTDRQDDQS